MLERGDMLTLHEPLEGLEYIGPLEIVGRSFSDPASLVEWLLRNSGRHEFLKETVNPPILDLALAHRRFLQNARHAFLIRRPEEIAASWFALEGDMRIQESGLRGLHQLYEAVRDAQGKRPVVIDSHDLVAQPEATMRAYCEASGLPFVASALTWEEGERSEGARTSRWHTDASASTGFALPRNDDRHGLASHPAVQHFAAEHRPFFEDMYSHRLRVDPV